jgi:CRISPR-associated protein (TIGR02710 family)
LRFDSALTLLDSVKAVWLGNYEQRLAEGLRMVAKGYGAWDRFEFARATGELEKLAEHDVPDLVEFQPERAVLGLLPTLKPDRGLSADRLADLFNNAGRRLAEGRYDDALARLYRLAEMLVQWILLKEYEIDTAAVDLEKAPADVKAWLPTHRNADGKIQIGLDSGYRLLKSLGHRVGVGFDEGVSRGIGVLLKKRNVSLLAHGLEPIAKADVESLMTKVRQLITLAVPDFDDRRWALEFPWRRSTQPAGIS